MRLSNSVLLVAAATAVAGDQKILNKGGDYHSPLHVGGGGSRTGFDWSVDFDSWAKPLKTLYGDITAEAKATWDEVSQLAPEVVETFKHSLASKAKPKKIHGRPDAHWDHIIKGADVQALWVKGEDGEDRRKVGGKLDNYDVRVRKVDPSKLGVDTVKQYSGYLDDNEQDKHLFYWFFESRNDPKNDPVILWLNGGPGCSSLLGLFMELGPASINKNGKVIINPSSWNSNASVIFIDQPVNVGYSYGSGSVSNTAAAAKDIYALLTLFFHQFPEYAEQDFHIAGESYGGHYVPIMAQEILSHKERNINLKSALIGNGLTDGYTQYEYYRPMGCGDGGYPAVLDESQCQSMDNALPRCQSLIQSCYDSESVWSCVPAILYCNAQFIGPYQQTGQNPYDVREKCKGGNLCYDEMSWITDFLNRDDVQDELGVEPTTFDSCNFDINRNFMFQGDWMLPIVRVVPGLLEQIPIVVYAGDADFICNWLGNQAWTDRLEWAGQKEYGKAKSKDLVIEGSKKPYGKVKSAKGLTFMQIFEAGHMVPYDQPEASIDFLNRWIAGEWAK
ncbi:hypothetical protein MY1884_008313 [Beauveria asiatica]